MKMEVKMKSRKKLGEGRDAAQEVAGKYGLRNVHSDGQYDSRVYIFFRIF